MRFINHHNKTLVLAIVAIFLQLLISSPPVVDAQKRHGRHLHGRHKSVPSSPVVGDGQEGKPITRAGLLGALENGRRNPAKRYTAGWYIDHIRQLHVSFQLTRADEQEIRRSGAYLGAAGLNELINTLLLNYYLDHTGKFLVLRRGQVVQEEDPTGYKFTFVNKDGDDYIIQVQPMNKDSFELRTHPDCEHIFMRAGHSFAFRPVRGSFDQVRVEWAERTGSSVPPEALDVIPLPEIRLARITPCDTIKMLLVGVNVSRAQGSQMAHPYYISEPVTIGMLRLYQKNRHFMLPIPPDAKDTDPVTEIYYEDALSVAKALKAQLPSLEQLRNALATSVLASAPQTELVENQEGGLSQVWLPDLTLPAKTLTQLQGAAYVVPKGSPAIGLLRLVCPINQACPAQMPKRVFTEQNSNTVIVPRN